MQSHFTYITILWGKSQCVHLQGKKIRPRQFKWLVHDLAYGPELPTVSVRSKYLLTWTNTAHVRTDLGVKVQFLAVLLHPSCTELLLLELCSSSQWFIESSVRPYFVTGPVRSTKSSSEGGSGPHRAHPQVVGVRAGDRLQEERGKQYNFRLWQMLWRKQAGWCVRE